MPPGEASQVIPCSQAGRAAAVRVYGSPVGLQQANSQRGGQVRKASLRGRLGSLHSGTTMKQHKRDTIRAAVANIRAWHEIVIEERPGANFYLQPTEYALSALEALAEGRNGPHPDEFMTPHRRMGSA